MGVGGHRLPSPPVRLRFPASSPRPVGRSALEALGGLLAVLVALAMLGSCSGSRPSLGSLPPSTTRNTTSTTQAVDGTTTSTSTIAPSAPRDLGPADLLGYIATPVGDPVVYEAPSDKAKVLQIGPKTEAGAPTTFAIVGDAGAGAHQAHPGWYEVELPTRPNSGTGWVKQPSVTVTKTPMRLFVDLDARRLRVEKDGKEVLTAPVAIGTLKNPTPTGGTYVTELVQYASASGSYGPFAFGLALHSPTLTEFEGGDGRVALHGTNHPKLIGQRVSHGCVRMANADVLKLKGLELPLGVPVFIT
jgi:lipoprotein-anchoring transpeptidase ErfK/SrfK